MNKLPRLVILERDGVVVDDAPETGLTTAEDWRLALAFAAVFPVHWVGIRFVLPVLTPRFAAERRSASA